MRVKIMFLGQLTPTELSEISDFLGTNCTTLGSWAKYTRVDSPFKFTVCSNGQHFIRLSGYDTKGLRFYKIKEVKTYVTSDGYVYVSGFSALHQLVAWAFIPDYAPYPEKEVNHKDGNKLNNTVDNLEMVHHKQNMEHFWSADCMQQYREAWLSKHVGRPWTELQRKSYMTNHRSHQWTEEERLKMSLRHKGKKLSAEHITRIKEANRGNTWSRGKISVTNGVKNATINPEDLHIWESMGFHRGRHVIMPEHKAPYKHTLEFLEKQRLRKLSKEASSK